MGEEGRPERQGDPMRVQQASPLLLGPDLQRHRHTEQMPHGRPSYTCVQRRGRLPRVSANGAHPHLRTGHAFELTGIVKVQASRATQAQGHWISKHAALFSAQEVLTHRTHRSLHFTDKSRSSDVGEVPHVCPHNALASKEVVLALVQMHGASQPPGRPIHLP